MAALDAVQTFAGIANENEFYSRQSEKTSQAVYFVLHDPMTDVNIWCFVPVALIKHAQQAIYSIAFCRWNDC